MKIQTCQTISLALVFIVILVLFTGSSLGQETSTLVLTTDKNTSISLYSDSNALTMPETTTPKTSIQTNNSQTNETNTNTGAETTVKTIGTVPLLDANYENMSTTTVATAVEIKNASAVTAQPTGNLDGYEILPEDLANDLDAVMQNSSDEKEAPLEITKEQVTTRSKEGNLKGELTSEKTADQETEFKKISPIKLKPAPNYPNEISPDFLQDSDETAEVINQNIELSEAFIDEGTDVSELEEVSLEMLDDEMYVLVPEEFQDSDTAHIELTDAQNDSIADIVISYGDVVRIVERVEEREIDSMRLITREEETDIKTLSNQSVTIKVHLDAQLDHLNRKASLDLNMQTSIDPKIEEQFSSLAQSQSLGLIDRAGVLTVNKTALSNEKDIGQTNVFFKIEKTWQGTETPERVKILRYDEETGHAQILLTTYAGDESGYAVFQGHSPDGLSTFAVFMVETIESGGPSSFSIGALKRFGLPILIIVLVGGIFVGTFLSRGESRGKHKKKHA